MRAAFQVSAHIFDVALRVGPPGGTNPLAIGFASQVAYLRSELDPNAVAIYKRHFRDKLTISALEASDGNTSLALAIAFLGMDTPFILGTTAALRDDTRTIPERWGVETYMDTVYAGILTIALAVRGLNRPGIVGGSQS
jgi:hypothetical protein